VTAIILDNPRYILERPRRVINSAAGVILGFVIGAIVVLVMENLESGIIRSRNDIERFLRVSVIGSIPPDGRHFRHNGK
jgi:capsular polysaccharide biosynthesis protein